MNINHQHTKADKRKTRVRSRITGTAKRPRLSLFRSNKHLHAQLIDDQAQETLLSLCTINLNTSKLNKTQQAEKLAQKLAEQALKQDIKQAILDRGSYRYHGRIKAFTEAVRKAGLTI